MLFGPSHYQLPSFCLVLLTPVATAWLACPKENPRKVAKPPPTRPGERGLQLLGWRVLDLRHTFEFLAGGASFIRLQLEDFRWLRGADEQLTKGFEELLRGRQGQSCLAVDDVLSRNWDLAYPAESELLMHLRKNREALVRELLTLRPSAGVLCNRQVVDAAAWNKRKASKFELQELWKIFFRDRKVLVIIGELFAPTYLEFFLQGAQSAAARYVQQDEFNDGLAGLLSDLRANVEDFDVALVVGFPDPLGALLSAGLDCAVQTIDGGLMTIQPRAGKSHPEPPPLTSTTSGGWAYPRPHLRRDTRWLLLNGQWDVHISPRDAPALPASFHDGVVEVPYPIESHSGGSLRISEHELLWLRRRVPSTNWGRTLLHVDGCDWECSIFVNGVLLGTHQGAYDPFTFELPPDEAVWEIIMRVWDPTDSGCEYKVDEQPHCHRCCESGWQPRGKQSLQPGFIMYSAATGPWQSIWLEEVPQACLIHSAETHLLQPRADSGVRLEVQVAPGCELNAKLTASVLLRGQTLVEESSSAGAQVVDLPPLPELWSPDRPTMYTAQLALCDSTCDRVTFHFALRWLSKSESHGPKEEVTLLLNGEPVFQSGVLYQGYWPESLIALPGPLALEELREIKAMGFNLVRVHATVLPAIFYHFCDQEGLLVWQDFPAGDGRALPLWDSARGTFEQTGTVSPLEMDEIQRFPESASNFWKELEAMISWLRSFGSIVCWVPFNEAWGQFQTMQVVQWLRQFGGNRWINMASGWNDVADLFPGMDAGDLVDAHNYENLPYEGLNLGRMIDRRTRTGRQVKLPQIRRRREHAAEAEHLPIVAFANAGSCFGTRRIWRPWLSVRGPRVVTRDFLGLWELWHNRSLACDSWSWEHVCKNCYAKTGCLPWCIPSGTTSRKKSMAW
ncbi:unnamed protein product [Durusdinium trenchii]|uniref:Beta-galactosidase n=1 Tax=Durusdinium trenchii TaxID=1381693 RepID=A0ABP0JR76_9DINO